MNVDTTIPIDQSSWIAVRSFYFEAERRIRFAHTAPWHIEVAAQPVLPRKREVEFLVRRVRETVLPQDALAEYRKALEIYEEILLRAVDE